MRQPAGPEEPPVDEWDKQYIPGRQVAVTSATLERSRPGCRRAERVNPGEPGRPRRGRRRTVRPRGRCRPAGADARGRLPRPARPRSAARARAIRVGRLRSCSGVGRRVRHFRRRAASRHAPRPPGCWTARASRGMSISAAGNGGHASTWPISASWVTTPGSTGASSTRSFRAVRSRSRRLVQLARAHDEGEDRGLGRDGGGRSRSPGRW